MNLSGGRSQKRYLMEPGYKTVDHIEQLDFSKLIGGPEVDLFDIIISSGPKRSDGRSQ